MINHPHMLQAASFIKDNSDLISAAKAEPLSREEIERARKPEPAKRSHAEHMKEMNRIAMQGARSMSNLWFQALGDAKIGTQFHIRLPADYVKSDGPTIPWQS